MVNKARKKCQTKKDDFFSRELVDDNAIYREFIANEMGESARRTLEKYATLYLGRTLGKHNAHL